MRTVHDVIEAHREQILRLWVQGVQESPFAEELSTPELAGIMPDYLGSLGRFSMDGPIQLSEQQRELIERHLSNRLRLGSTLNEILTEFTVLGRVLAWFLDRDSDSWRPSTRDAANLFAELHLACVATMKIFNEQLLEDEQPVKRYLRLLQNLAGDAGTLREGRQPLRILMKEALSLIRKAVGAQTAALRLLDAKSNNLIMTASDGDAEDLVEQFVASLDASPPAARLVPADGPAKQDGVDCTEVALSEALRAAGIHSLVAVRLAPRHVLRGVLYIGTRGRRDFSASEIRQIETLGEALIIHLDHAKLCTALRARADEAIAECQLRESFVSLLMHDLTGPLAAARAGAQALVGPGLDAREVIAANVVRELDRVEGMVDGLLDAHRIRAGHRLPMTISRCDLAVLAREMVAELRSTKGDRFIFEADTNVCGMWSADQLRRAIWNLATNALRFGAVDAPVLVSVRRGGEAAELIVHNEGAAIPMEEQAELFRPFSTPHSGRGHPPGWGLGLTLVWGCAEAHGGRVVVTSLPGQGTTFKLLIPYDSRPYAE